MLDEKQRYVKLLGTRLDQLRADRKWSYQDMASACKMDKAQVYSLCKSGKDLRASTLLKIAQGLGISVSELMNFEI